jgi:ATP-dependent RNA helicase RhlE
MEYIKDIHKLIGKQIPVTEAHPYPMNAAAIVHRQELNKQIAQNGQKAASSQRHPRSSGHRDGKRRFGGNKSRGKR